MSGGLFMLDIPPQRGRRTLSSRRDDRWRCSASLSSPSNVSEVGDQDGTIALTGGASSWVSTPFVSLDSAQMNIPNVVFVCPQSPLGRGRWVEVSSWPASALDGIIRCAGPA
jgi:hypothetical protein